MTRLKKYIIYIWGILLLSSCTNNKSEYPPALLPELEQAENVMYTYPDSALHILERMTPPKASDKYQHASWCILVSQAKVRNYIKMNTDSIISIAYNYFQKQNDPQRKALAGYLEGIYYNDEKHDGETALSFYLEAAKEIEKTEDYQLAHLLYSEIGHIYVYRTFVKDAITAFQNAYNFAKLSNNNKYISSALSYLGRAYSIKPDIEKAIDYYKEALKIAQEENCKFPATIALNELAMLYANFQEDQKQALAYAMETLRINKEEQWEPSQNYLIIGDTYRQLENYDSAQYYLNKALLTNDIYTKRSAYHALYLLNRTTPNNLIKAMQYCDKFYACIDSISEIKNSKEIIAISEKYKHEKLLNEKNTLQIKNERFLRNGLFALLFLILIISLLIYFYQRKLIKKERTIQSQEEQLRIYNLQIHDNESHIEHNKMLISQLSEQIVTNGDLQETVQEQQNMVDELVQKNKTLQNQTDKLQQDISEYSHQSQGKLKEQMISFNKIMEENANLRRRIELLSKLIIGHTDILASLIKSPQYLNPSQWAEIVEATNRIYDNFTKRLNKQIQSLSDSDLQVCCLIKLRIPVANMAIILGISATSVSKRKQRLKEQIAREGGVVFDKNQHLDIWIWDY